MYETLHIYFFTQQQPINVNEGFLHLLVVPINSRERANQKTRSNTKFGSRFRSVAAKQNFHQALDLLFPSSDLLFPSSNQHKLNPLICLRGAGNVFRGRP